MVAGVDLDQVFDLNESLARHSLIQTLRGASEPRATMLTTVRRFVAERMAQRSDVEVVKRRHAEYFQGLILDADVPLRGVGQTDWLGRLEADAGNLATALRWHLTHDPEPLPHLFRVLWPFFSLRDRTAEARQWVAEMLNLPGFLDEEGDQELTWAAVAYASDIGEYDAAAAARERLAPRIGDIRDPFLHALSELVNSWTLPIEGNLESAAAEASMSLSQLRPIGEPFWTAVAAFTAGTLETAVGHLADAEQHLTEASELAESFDSTALTAGSRVQLANLDILNGRPDEAHARLAEALNQSVDARSTPFITLCLSGLARLALSEGDPERAAFLEGAADGLRRRIGIRPWPILRHGESVLATEVVSALGQQRFDDIYAAGGDVSLRDALLVALRPGPATRQSPAGASPGSPNPGSSL